MVQLLNLVAQNLASPVLHNSGFAVSTDLPFIWQFKIVLPTNCDFGSFILYAICGDGALLLNIDDMAILKLNSVEVFCQIFMRFPKFRIDILSLLFLWGLVNLYSLHFRDSLQFAENIVFKALLFFYMKLETPYICLCQLASMLPILAYNYC